MAARLLLLSLLVAGAASGQAVRRPVRYIRVPVPVPVVGLPVRSALGGTSVAVIGPSRMDWRFAAPPGMAEDKPKAGGGNFAILAQDSYQLLLPPSVPKGGNPGLVLHLSASSAPLDATAWEPICRKHGLLFACPLGVGDEVSAAARLRLGVEVLDDVRRRFAIDTDRIYLSGVSGGAVTASQIAFSWPEACGGLLAVGGATSQRGDPYIRERVRRRLSVALVAGSLDAARHEVERYRFPVLRDSDVNCKFTVVPAMAKGMPPAAILEQQLAWLESKRAARQALGKESPTLRLAEKSMPAAQEWSQALLDEAKARKLAGRGVQDTLLILHGIAATWPALPAGREAKKMLDDHDRAEPLKWADVYNARQMQHFGREANTLDDFLKMLMAIRDGGRLAAALRPVAVQMWELVEQFAGPETRLGRKAVARLKELKRKP